MKIFILCISLVFGVFAIVMYAKSIKQRTRELAEKAKKKDAG